MNCLLTGSYRTRRVSHTDSPPSRRQNCPIEKNGGVRGFPSFAKEGWLRHKENGPVP